MDTRTTRRLTLSLAAALALHGMVLHFLRFPVSPAIAGRKTALEVVLSVAHTPPPANFRDARRISSAAGTITPPPRPAEDGEPEPAPIREPRPSISAAQLLESARWIIREEFKNAAPNVVGWNERPADATVEARLARALRPPSASERRLDESLVKITTASGTTYCLKAPPERLRDGPGEAISVPTTCP